MNYSDFTPTGVTMVTLNQQNKTTQKCQGSSVSINTIYSLTCLYVAIFVVSLVGNTMVILNALKRSRPKSPFERLIINMATADIVDSVFAVPLWVAFIHVGLQWLPGFFGVFLCKLTYFAINTSITSSVLTFSVIAIDRYFAIVSRAQKPLSKRIIKYSIVGIWFIAALIFSTDLYITQVKVRSGQPICYQNLNVLGRQIVKIDTVLKFLLGYIIPLLLMTTLYSKILCFLYKWQIPGNQSEKTSRHVQKYRKSTVKKLVTIVVVFAACWFPVHIFHFLGQFNRPVFCRMPMDWLLWVNWLAHSNSAINPCLYLYLSRRKQWYGKMKTSREIPGRRKATRLLSRLTRTSSIWRSKSHEEEM